MELLQLTNVDEIMILTLLVLAQTHTHKHTHTHTHTQLVEGFPLVRTRIEAIGQSRVRNQARTLVESLRSARTQHKHVSGKEMK